MTELAVCPHCGEPYPRQEGSEEPHVIEDPFPEIPFLCAILSMDCGEVQERRRRFNESRRPFFLCSADPSPEEQFNKALKEFRLEVLKLLLRPAFWVTGILAGVALWALDSYLRQH